jgi:rRNA maturation endonuclease Nob1
MGTVLVEAPESVPLAYAYLCEDCTCIARPVKDVECPICGSKALLCVAKILNRTTGSRI